MWPSGVSQCHSIRRTSLVVMHQSVNLMCRPQLGRYLFFAASTYCCSDDESDTVAFPPASDTCDWLTDCIRNLVSVADMRYARCLALTCTKCSKLR